MKRSIYPFGVTLTSLNGQPPAKGQVVKLAKAGFLVQFGHVLGFRTGDQLTANFQVPMSDSQVNETVTVVKNYITFAGEGSKIKVQLVEFHFVSLDPSRADVIEQLVHATEPPEES